MRLDYRITYLLSIYKKEFGDNSISENSSVAEMPPMSREIFLFCYVNLSIFLNHSFINVINNAAFLF